MSDSLFDSPAAELRRQLIRKTLFVGILGAVAMGAFLAGLAWSSLAARAEGAEAPQAAATAGGGNPKVIYPKHTDLDFEGLKLQGEVHSPGEFYFQHRGEEKFDSLVKRRRNFHREMLRDAVLSK